MQKHSTNLTPLHYSLKSLLFRFGLLLVFLERIPDKDQISNAIGPIIVPSAFFRVEPGELLFTGYLRHCSQIGLVLAISKKK
jgi:hypothetical protein